MKKIILALVFICTLSGCYHSIVSKDDFLAQAEEEIEANPDSILSVLTNEVNVDNLNDYNKAYYYLLIAESKLNCDERLFPIDSVLNFAMKEFFDTKDEILYAKALFYKGIIFEETKVYPEAIICYHKALDELKDADDNLKKKIYSYLGDLYLSQQLYDEALDTFRKSYKIAMEGSNKTEKLINARNVALTYLYLNYPDSAHLYYNYATEVAASMESPGNYKDIIYNDLGIYYNELGNNEEALYFINQISTYDDRNHLNKGMILLSLNELDSAYYHLQQSLESDDLGIQSVAYNQLSKLEKKRKNYQSAMNHIEAYIELYDSLTEISYTAEIHGINIKHNIKTEIARIKHQKNSSIRLVINIGMFILVTIIFSFILNNRIKKRKVEEEKLIKEKQILEKEKQISNLQNCIINTRNTIARLKYENENAGKLTSDLNEKEKSLLTLQCQLNNMRIQLFQQKMIYKKIQNLSNQKETDFIQTLNSKEREELKITVEEIYSDFIDELQLRCPYLSDEDLLFCCLGKLNLNLIIISICTGYPRLNSARQRRYRIKKKMEEELAGDVLYTSIFTF